MENKTHECQCGGQCHSSPAPRRFTQDELKYYRKRGWFAAGGAIVAGITAIIAMCMLVDALMHGHAKSGILLFVMCNWAVVETMRFINDLAQCSDILFTAEQE